MFQQLLPVDLQGSLGAPGILPAGDGAQPGSQYCLFGDAPALCRNDLLVPGRAITRPSDGPGGRAGHLILVPEKICFWGRG